MSHAASRRHLLQFLAASPFFAQSALSQGLRWSDPVDWAPRDLDKLIADPTQALDVFDFEPVMKQNVPPAHFGYMATGVDDEVTLRANREGFRKFELRPRRLVDVSKIDMSVEILGTKFDSPIVIAPTSSSRAFHPDGDVAVAKAAKAGNHLQILSTVATTSIEDAIADLKESLKGSDAEAITAKTNALAQASMKLGEAMYKQAGAGADPDASGKKDDVVDAEFTEVDDDKKKSA